MYVSSLRSDGRLIIYVAFLMILFRKIFMTTFIFRNANFKILLLVSAPH